MSKDEYAVIQVTPDGNATVTFPDGTVMTGGMALRYDDGRVEVHWPDGTVTRSVEVRSLHS